MTWIIITIVGLVAGTLSGIVGFGSTTILMPLLVIFFGPKAAVPIMAVAAVLGNLGRVVVVVARHCLAGRCSIQPHGHWRRLVWCQDNAGV